MAERNQKVFDRVKQELERNPQLGSRELFGVAQTVDKAVSQDTMQQFHARYFLPAKRELNKAAGAAPARKRPGRKAKEREAVQERPEQSAAPKRGRRAAQKARQGGDDREQVRAALLQFAQELTDAESRSSLVKVLGRVDSYVDRIVGAGK